MNEGCVVAIVGGGPAGASVAIYLKRVGIDPLLFERKRIGGLLINANLIENYPGFPEGISGKSLVDKIERQLKNIGVRVIQEEVTGTEASESGFRVNTAKDHFLADFLVMATGTRPKPIELKGQETLLGKRIFYELTDLPSNSSEKHFLVIGGGDAAFDYALSLAAKGSRADILFKSGEPRCISLLKERAKSESNIGLFPRTIPEVVHWDGEHMTFDCRRDDETVQLRGDYAIIACGREPEMATLPEMPGNISGPGEHQLANLFLIGDLMRGKHRQVGIAVGDGIAAAMKIADQIFGMV